MLYMSGGCAKICWGINRSSIRRTPRDQAVCTAEPPAHPLLRGKANEALA